VYLVGNMADLEEQRQVQKEEAEALVKELKFQKYIETSAFTGMNIDEAFTTMTKHLFVKHENELDTYKQNDGDDDNDRKSGNLVLRQDRPKSQQVKEPKKGGCCK